MSKTVVREFYLHGEEESSFDGLEGLKMTYEAHRNAANWAYEIQFRVEIDLETGHTKIIALNEGNGWRTVNG